MTQDEFARAIHKSKSAISKYECGQTTLDIELLYEIADVLEISVNQLMDYNIEKVYRMPGISGFFAAPTRLYTYYLNKNSTRIVRGVLEINRLDDCEYSTILYADLASFDNLYSCTHLYYGDIHYSDTYTNMVLVNQANEAERIYANIANPFNNNATITVGMLCGISGKYLVPIAMKALFSKIMIDEDEDLRGALRFTKDDFKSMKQTCCFSIDRLPILRNLESEL